MQQVASSIIIYHTVFRADKTVQETKTNSRLHDNATTNQEFPPHHQQQQQHQQQQRLQQRAHHGVPFNYEPGYQVRETRVYCIRVKNFKLVEFNEFKPASL